MGERAALAVALFLATFGVALPGIALLWFVAVILASGATAEALEHSGGLEPTTFGGGYWMAMGANVAVVLWSLVRRLRGRPAPWHPLAWLIATHVTLIWFAAFPDLATDLDVPDVVTTFALLGADALVSYAFPLVLLAVLLRGLGHLWRVGGASSAAAQRIGIVAACFGLGSLTLGAGLAVVDVEPKTLEAAAEEFGSALDADGVEGERRMYAAMSLGLAGGISSGTTSKPQVSNAFGECAETLSRPRFDKRPVVEEATRRLMRAGMGKADAEDIVMDTLVRVCLEHADEGLDDLIPYYSIALKNNARRFHARTRRGPVMWDDELLGDERDLPADARLELSGELETLRAALSRLSPADRYVLELRHVDGLSYADIGKRLGKSEAAARQQVKRARERLRQAWRQEAHRH